MDDFDLARPVDEDTSLKEKSKKISIVISAVFFVFLFIFISISLIKHNKPLIDTGSASIPRIKSKIQKIKSGNEKDQNDKTLNVDIYNLLDSKDKISDKEIIINDNALNDIRVPTYNKDVAESEEDLFSLEKKIEEISNQDIEDIIKEEENKKTEIKTNNVKNNKDIPQKAKVVNQPKQPKITYDILKKELKNDALAKHLASHKDHKPTKRVQLAALTSKELAEKYWKNISEKYSNFFKGKDYYIENVNLGEKGIFYRLQVGNFETKDEANTFCKDYLKLKGGEKMDCILINID